jgi:hypothetical protein
MRTRLAKLDRRLPALPAPETPDEEKCRRQIAQRLDRLITNATLLLTKQEAKEVSRGLEQWIETGSGPYSSWFKELIQGHCRLPELAPESMKQLLLAWLSPECDTLMPVCRSCGLLYPHRRSPPMTEWKLLPGKAYGVGPPPWYDFPVFFQSCPGCNASSYEMDWSHLVREVSRPWKALDGCICQILHRAQEFTESSL